MQIVISHVNTDFDALASMIAAKKIHPDAQLVISDQLEYRVQRFLNIYRDMFDFMPIAHIDWEQVTEMIIVDVASLSRIGKLPDDFNPATRKIIVYDHHPKSDKDVAYDEGIIEPTGAAVTILLEEIEKQNLPISQFEASLFGIGIYTDTGNFTHNSTTVRDFQMASYLLEQGMQLEMVQRFSEQTMTHEQQELFDHLLTNTEIQEIDGLEIAISTYELKKYQNGLAMITTKLLDVKSTDAVISVVKMKHTVVVVGRASSQRITLLPILKKFGGGGHKHAGSATIKKGDREEILQLVTENIHLMLKPAITAKDLMTYPVKTLSPDTTIEEAGKLMYRYGHSGYPIVENGRLTGLITRRDLDKANHHGLGHAPVKAYMTTDVVTIEPGTTLEEIQELVIKHNIGRLPVIINNEIAGIVTRTNIIQVLHDDVAVAKKPQQHLNVDDITEMMEELLPTDVCVLLKQIGETASEMGTSVYLIGGIVRDILLGKPNNDIDIVAEGDGIRLAKSLEIAHGGHITEHTNFGTATWVHPSGLSIDVTSARLEYYEQPGSLPEVETSLLGDDLQRRDFTINAMAIRLNEEAYGELIDPFGGQQDLTERKIKILHNMSFVEDPTRIFRAVRFEERFGFLMDVQTQALALESISKVIQLSPQRIIEEMKRLFTEAKPQDVIRRLFELHVWQQYGIHEKFTNASSDAAETLQKLYSEQAQTSIKTIADEQAAWFNYFLLPFFCSDNLYVAEKFALTKKRKKLLEEVTALHNHDKWKTANLNGDYHMFLHNYSNESILFLLAACEIPNKQDVINYLQLRRDLPTYITGADLVKAGLKPGPTFSEVLLLLEASQLNGDLTSKDDALIWLKEFL